MKKIIYIMLTMLIPLTLVAKNENLSKEEQDKKYKELKRKELENIIRINKKYRIKNFKTYEEYAKACNKVRSDLIKNSENKDALLAAYSIAFKIKNKGQYEFPIRLFIEENWERENWESRKSAVSSLEDLIFEKKGKLSKELKEKLITKLNNHISQAPPDNADAPSFVSSAKDLLKRLKDYNCTDNSKPKQPNYKAEKGKKNSKD